MLALASQGYSTKEETQFSNEERGTDSSTMGIKLWFAPQISEHCP